MRTPLGVEMSVENVRSKEKLPIFPPARGRARRGKNGALLWRRFLQTFPPLKGFLNSNARLGWRRRPQPNSYFGLNVLHLAFFFAIASCVSAAEPFDRTKLAKIDGEIEQAIAEGKLPGGVLWLEHKGNHYHKAYGDRALLPDEE